MSRHDTGRTRQLHVLTAATPLLITSDVDGTLLDERGELPCTSTQLRNALQQLRAKVATCTLALASSRTLLELAVLQRAIGIAGPCIAEDGALLAIDEHQLSVGVSVPTSTMKFGTRTLQLQRHARTSTELRERMRDVPLLDRADASRLTRERQTALGFRSSASIRRALTARHHSVLLDPTVMSDDEQSTLRRVARERSLHVRRGGKWLTLSDTEGKGPALLSLRQQSTWCGVSPFLVAIGNEENDLSLLEVADLAFVVRNPQRGPHPALSAIPHAVVLDTEGPGGWLEMLNRLQDLVA